MKQNPRAMLVIAALTALTIGLKATLDVPVNYQKLHPALMATVRAALVAKGFQPLVQTDFRVITAFKGGCLIWIGTSTPEGGGDSAFTAAYGSMGQVSFWYRGQLFTRLPGTTALIDRYLERATMAIGARPKVHPIYHLISTSECNLHEIRDLPLEDPKLSET